MASQTGSVAAAFQQAHSEAGPEDSRPAIKAPGIARRLKPHLAEQGLNELLEKVFGLLQEGRVRYGLESILSAFSTRDGELVGEPVGFCTPNLEGVMQGSHS